MYNDPTTYQLFGFGLFSSQFNTIYMSPCQLTTVGGKTVAYFHGLNKNGSSTLRGFDLTTPVWRNESVYTLTSDDPKYDYGTGYYKSEYLFNMRFVVDDSIIYQGASCNMGMNRLNNQGGDMNNIGGYNHTSGLYGVVYWLRPEYDMSFDGVGIGRQNASKGWDTVTDSLIPPVPTYADQYDNFYVGIVLSTSVTTLKQGISRYYYFTKSGLYGCRVTDGNTVPVSLLIPWISAGDNPIHIGCYYNDLFYASASMLTVVTVNPNNQNVNRIGISPPGGHTYKYVHHDDKEFVCTTEDLNTWMYINGHWNPFYNTAPISSNLTLTPYALNFNGFKFVTNGDIMTMKDSDNQPIMTITKGDGIKFNYPIIS
jgi:hypothetical protein